MPVPVFSVNAASLLLERDRRTITKALRNTPPDKKERGQRRWRLRTILDALDELPGSHNANTHYNANNDSIVIHHNWLDPANWRDKRIVASITDFNEAFAEMQAIEDMTKRRAFAIAKLAPLIAFHDRNFRAWETDNPAPGRFATDTDSVSARVCLLWSQQMEAVQGACEWDSDEGRKFLADPFDDEDD
jgi:hypothetical protein